MPPSDCAAAEQRVAVGNAERAGHRARAADVARQPPGVDARDARHLVPAEEAVEIVGRAPVRRPAGQIADDHAPASRGPRLVVALVDAVVPDVRIRERDDLPGVRRIGEDLLVARERGVEHDLARRHTVGGLKAHRFALEGLAVGQNQQRLGHLPAPIPALAGIFASCEHFPCHQMAGVLLHGDEFAAI